MQFFRKYLVNYWPALFVITYAVILYMTAWLSDDSYITLRSVDNFVNGLGPVWNPSERVQVFTHPLWYLVLSSVYFFTNEAFFTTLSLSLLISIVAFSLFAYLSKPSMALAISLSILLFSNAYIDYSTSGLENPLTHLLVFCFIFYYLREQPNIFLLSGIAGLIMFNRIDLILLFIPALLWLFIQSPSWKTIYTFMLGFLPFMIWEIFATFYYGFPFPNTAYAKLNVQLPLQEILQQGVWYFVNSLRIDPITLTAIFTGILLAFKSRSLKITVLALGTVFYLLYIVWIGGDFMSGRFFSSPLLISILLLHHSLEHAPLKGRHLSSLFAVIFLLKCWSLIVNPSFLNIQHRASFELIDAQGIADEQTIYVAQAGLMGASFNEIQPRSIHVQEGIQHQNQGQHVFTDVNIGYLGFFVGPEVHIIDQYALADPLLARIPFTEGEWRPGHFFHALPKGYLETIVQKKNVITNPALAEYYDVLRLVTRGDLFNRNRLIAIWKFNTGQYNHLMDEYLGHELK
jgi:arabinofuranosyltransferase